MSKTHTPKPPYPVQFREQMIELVCARHKPGKLARMFGCHITKHPELGAPGRYY